MFGCVWPEHTRASVQIVAGEATDERPREAQAVAEQNLAEANISWVGVSPAPSSGSAALRAPELRAPDSG